MALFPDSHPPALPGECCVETLPNALHSGDCVTVLYPPTMRTTGVHTDALYPPPLSPFPCSMSGVVLLWSVQWSRYCMEPLVDRLASIGRLANAGRGNTFALCDSS